MIKVKTIYKTNETELSRIVENDAHLPMVIGEMLYGIKVQNNQFDTNSVFNSLEIPEHFKHNTTIADNDEWYISISTVRRK